VVIANYHFFIHSKTLDQIAIWTHRICWVNEYMLKFESSLDEKTKECLIAFSFSTTYGE
jgi:hypothetical protein